MMRRLVAVSLVLYLVFMVYIFVGGLVLKRQSTSPATRVNNHRSENEGENESEDDGTKTTAPSQTTPPAGSNNKSYTSSEVSSHKSKNDCWLIIERKVYDVTKFIPDHPGGEQQIVPYCGQDATDAFATKGGQGSHSQTANDLLSQYFIGNLQK